MTATSTGIVLYVTSLKDNKNLSITSIWTSLIFLINDISYFLTKSSSVKQTEAHESNKAKTLWFFGPKKNLLEKKV